MTPEALTGHLDNLDDPASERAVRAALLESARLCPLDLLEAFGDVLLDSDLPTEKGLLGRWKCPKCGKGNRGARATCRHCGAARGG